MKTILILLVMSLSACKAVNNQNGDGGGNGGTNNGNGGQDNGCGHVGCDPTAPAAPAPGSTDTPTPTETPTPTATDTPTPFPTALPHQVVSFPVTDSVGDLCTASQENWDSFCGSYDTDMFDFFAERPTKETLQMDLYISIDSGHPVISSIWGIKQVNSIHAETEFDVGDLPLSWDLPTTYGDDIYLVIGSRNGQFYELGLHVSVADAAGYRYYYTLVEQR